jgi:predicted nucleic acid-binding Zn ribbon protein
MERLDRTAVRAVRQLIADQPLTDKKVAFAWTLAAGPTLARASRVSWSDGVLRVEASTETWRRELARARPVLIKRIEELLGEGVVRTITVVLSSRAAASKAGRFSR